MKNELRVGNLIMNDFGEVQPVYGVDEKSIITKVEENGWSICFKPKPIELDRDWFEKLGFTYYSLPTRSNRKIGYYTLKYGSKFKIGRSGDNYAFSNFRKPLKYVHELQNLCFSLTAIELTVA
jgi:hypothetical protein